MKMRTKWFLGVLLVSIIAAMASTGVSSNGIAHVALLCFIGWVIWHGLVFLRILLRPVKKAWKDNPLSSALNERINQVNAHVDSSLRDAGLSKVADFADGVDKGIKKATHGIDGALDTSEKSIRDRNTNIK